MTGAPDRPARIELRPIPAEDVEAHRVMYEAFREDPTVGWLFQADQPGYEARLRAYLDIGHAWHARVGHPIVGAFDESTLLGVMYAMQPHIETPRELVAELEAALIAGCGREGADRFARYNAAVEEVAPEGRHYMLALVGVLPARHGQGIGSRLVQWLADECDGDPASDGILLDTGKPANVRFYERHGYRPVAEVSIDSLRETVMLRPRRAATDGRR